MPKKTITLSEIHKKYLKTALYLLLSWIVALLLSYILRNPSLVGLAPLINYVSYVIEKELFKDDGYLNYIQKNKE